MATRKRLEAYRQKRDFAVTPEPPPAEAKSERAGEGPLSFMVHKHDASRLHYDLRLELDGALASWAIPKGPSYDPSLKRLAVQTEDHPLAYGHFEGRIPEGEYGAGDSIIWDEGTYDTVPPGQARAQREKGHLHLKLAGEKLRGEWHLVRTRPLRGKAQWLCFKAKDGLERAGYDVVSERPESVQSGRRLTRGPLRRKVVDAPHPTAEALLKKVWPPMQATLARPDATDDGGFLYEVKYDGFRGLAAISNGRLAFATRNAIDLSARFPEIARALSRLHVAEAVVDGEVVSLDEAGISRFQRMADPDAERRFVAFDLLWLDGEDLRSRPLEERRELLESVLANVPPPVQLAERVAGPAPDALEEAQRRGWEGLIAKRQGSRYTGLRSREWLKLKLHAAQELAILGFTPIKNGQQEIGALLVGVHEPRGFRFAGKVGTGFSAKIRRQLYRELTEDLSARPTAFDAPRMRDARWVTPRKVAQVAFTAWTRDGKLRAPSFVGLRDDKRPEDVVREEPGVRSPVGRRSGALRAPAQRAARHARATPEPQIEVALTHPDRVLFPRSGLTKRDVFDYYQAVAPQMVRALAGRPLSIQQWPQGIARPGFFRQAAQAAPAWSSPIQVAHEQRTLAHWNVARAETLLLLANHSALTLHMWSSRTPHLEEPDWVVFDLDPGTRGFQELVEVALALRGLLEELALSSVPKTSGKSGLHVLVPVARGHTHQDAVDFAVAVTRALASRLPRIATTERSIKKRGGRLYLDAFQNGWGKTVVAPYSLRALEGAPVSAPLRWREVTPALDPLDFNLKTMPDRLAKVGDLFAPALEGKQRLPRFGDADIV